MISPTLGDAKAERAYALALRSQPGWRLLVVVPSASRAAWYQRLASRLSGWAHGGPGVVVVLDSVIRSGLDAPVVTLGGPRAEPFRSALPDRAGRATATPVGTIRWVELLGSGGSEQLNDALRP